jgi:hypothetical protein
MASRRAIEDRIRPRHGQMLMTRHRRTARPTLTALFCAFALALPAPSAFAVEEPAFEVVVQEGNFEVRRYAAYRIVTTPGGTDFDAAGNAGFRTLFRYISGANDGETDIAMTAPVLQARDESHWSLAFVVPAAYAPGAIPMPADQNVTIAEIPGGLYAALRFSGRWSEARFMERESALRAHLSETAFVVCGPTRYARYDPPFKPPFLRRNEILIPVGKDACPP